MTNLLDAPRPDPVLPTTATAEPAYYSITQAAALLRVSRVSIWRWIGAGRLPVRRLGHRTTRIRREDLERLLAGTGAEGSGDSRRAPRPDWREVGTSEHFVQFYEADGFLLDTVGEFIGPALRTGEAAIVVATEAHRAGLEQRFRAAG